MAKLVVFGKELNWDEEIEITHRGEFGMNCILTYKDGEGTNETRRNCTEFHHRFGSSMGRVSSAFESDIHTTGGTMDVDRLEKIEVEIATELAKEHWDKF